MSTAIAAVPDSPFIVAPERNGKEIELARSTVYLEFSIPAHVLNKRDIRQEI
jgi:hypothetical protein